MEPFGSLTIFTNPSARAGYDTRSIFKWSLTGLNSEFSFSKTSCLTKAKESSLPYYLLVFCLFVHFSSVQEASDETYLLAVFFLP